jgi:hypothetical protein
VLARAAGGLNVAVERLRLQTLQVAKWSRDTAVRSYIYGSSLQGRELTLLVIGQSVRPPPS